MWFSIDSDKRIKYLQTYNLFYLAPFIIFFYLKLDHFSWSFHYCIILVQSIQMCFYASINFSISLFVQKTEGLIIHNSCRFFNSEERMPSIHLCTFCSSTKDIWFMSLHNFMLQRIWLEWWLKMWKNWNDMLYFNVSIMLVRGQQFWFFYKHMVKRPYI